MLPLAFALFVHSLAIDKGWNGGNAAGDDKWANTLVKKWRKRERANPIYRRLPETTYRTPPNTHTHSQADPPTFAFTFLTRNDDDAFAF